MRKILAYIKKLKQNRDGLNTFMNPWAFTIGTRVKWERIDITKTWKRIAGIMAPSRSAVTRSGSNSANPTFKI